MSKPTPKLISSALIALFATLTALFIWQATRFEIDASADTLLVKDNRDYLITQQANQRYSPSEFVLIAFRPESGDIFSRDTFSIVQDISNQVAKLERVESVRSILNVPIFTGLESLSTDITPDSLTWESQQYSSAEMERKLAAHPLYEGLLINDRQTALSMQVVFKPNPELEKLQSRIVEIKSHLLSRELTGEEEKQLESLQAKQDRINKQLEQVRAVEIDQIRKIVATHREAGEFFLGGANLLADQLISIIKSDLLLFGSVISAVVCLILFFLFRKPRWVILPMACCGVSVIFTLGLLGMLGLKVTVISANVIALQIILTLALIVHLIVRYQELLSASHYTAQHTLVWDSVKSKVKPSFYAGLTTAIGFGSLIFSGIQPVISFGWMMVVALAVTLLVSLVLFPALLVALLNIPPVVKEHDFIRRGMNVGAGMVERRPNLIIILSVVLFAAGVAGCFRLSAENSFLNYFSESTDVYRELSFIDKHFGGSTPLDVLYTIPKSQIQSDLVITAGAVQTVSKIHNVLREKEAVGNITSISDFTRIAKVVREKPMTEYELTVFYESLDKNLRRDLFGSYFSPEQNEVRISARIQDTTENLDRSQLLDSIQQDIANLGIDEENFTLTNLFVLYEDILSRLVNSQFLTLGIVYAAMAVILVIIFGSLKIALICLVPNVITTAVIMGTMGWAGIPLDLMTMTIAAVAMGISVDDTIHYVHRYLVEEKNDATGAVRGTHLSVGYAVVYTTIIIVIGFSALVFSDFVPSILFGVLTGIAMVVALATDITILPVLLRRYVSKILE